MKNRKRKFLVTLVIPPDVTVREMLDYIRLGVSNECGLYDNEYPISQLDRKTIRVRPVRDLP